MRAFTLIELLITIAIVVILAALLTPALIESRARAKGVGIPRSPVQVNWENVNTSGFKLLRTPTPGGWLLYGSSDILYVPDKNHEWLKPKVEAE